MFLNFPTYKYVNQLWKALGSCKVSRWAVLVAVASSLPGQKDALKGRKMLFDN